MPSSQEYLDYVLDLLSGLDDITYRKMMGEYVLYCQGKLFGGIYDDRFLVKPTDSATRLMPEAQMELPYEGGKAMLLVDSENRDFIGELVSAMCDELPTPKKRR